MRASLLIRQHGVAFGIVVHGAAVYVAIMISSRHFVQRNPALGPRQLRLSFQPLGDQEDQGKHGRNMGKTLVGKAVLEPPPSGYPTLSQQAGSAITLGALLAPCNRIPLPGAHASPGAAVGRGESASRPPFSPGRHSGRAGLCDVGGVGDGSVGRRGRPPH